MSLSKRQSRRLATLLAVMSGEDVPEPHLSMAIQDGLIARLYRGNLSLTERGLDEKNRLCTLAGLNIKYLSEVNRGAQSKGEVAPPVRGGDHRDED